jgi:oligopeptide transport system substrate-binding protein
VNHSERSADRNTTPRIRRGFPGAALLLLVLLLASCHRRETPVEIGDREQILHLGNSAEPGVLDPATAFSVTDANILQALFEGLVNCAPDARTIIPGAAQRWEISPDGRTYTFHLRAGLKWSNGDPLTSADFLYSFRRIIEPKLGSEMAIYVDIVAGAQDYREEKTSNFSGVGFRAPDPQTFEIILRERAPYLLSLLTLNPFYPVHRPTIERFGAYALREANWTRPGSLVCNGPFTLEEWRTNDAVAVAKNPRYWNAAHVRLSKAVFHPIDNVDTEEKAFRAGLLHVTRYLPAAKLDSYRHPLSPLLRSDPLVATAMIDVNVSRKPFDDERVRAAFALAVDRAALVRSVLRDGSRVADTLCVPGSGVGPGYVPRLRLAYDPAKARALLAAAGFPKGTGFPPVTLDFTTGKSNDQMVVEALQAMWERELGVRVALSSQEEKVRLDSLRTKNYQLLLFSWLDADDPAMLLQLYLGASPNNFTNWASADFDREFAAAGQSTSDAERETHLQDADALLVGALPLIPLYHSNQNYLMQPSVRGWQENPLGEHPLNDVYLVRSPSL